MIEFKNILLTTDMSPNANAAFDYAVALARPFGGSIRLLNIFEDTLFYSSAAGAEGYAFDPVEWLKAAIEDRERHLCEMAKELADREEIGVFPVLREGRVVPEILKAIQLLKVDCIVMATHGHTGLSHLLFGSVAERIVRMSLCPVMSIRPSKIHSSTRVTLPSPAKQERQTQA